MPNIWSAPQIPNKYEIVPIHNSDRAAFKRCRQYWQWSSPARNNLTIRADILGINIPMFFGTGCHYALEQYYTPGLKRDPVEAFKTWFDIQWRGGEVTEEWLDRVYDLNPSVNQEVSHSGSLGVGVIVPGRKTYTVRGLNDILPDPDPHEWDELLDLGIGMMTFYKEYAEKNDGFEVVVAEHNFSVPIWDYENDTIMHRIDMREESPNYGKNLEVHARGRMDELYTKPDGKMGILENKTAASIGEDYFLKLESDEQVTSYLWAAQVEANYYDLSHKGVPLDEVIFNVLRKAYPKPPTILKNGYSFSVDRTKESTTFDMLSAYIDGLPPEVFPSGLDEKQQAYLDYLRDVGDEQFIVRKLVRRNKHQLADAGQRLYLESLDMLESPRIYPNMSNDYNCLGCQFRAPCLAKMDGSDHQQLITDNYSVNRDR